jgi:transcriptional regulator with GAF, ATPase, and Fis domain
VLKNSDGQIIGAAETFRDISEIESLKKQLSTEYYTGNFQSRSPAMQSIFQLVDVVAPINSTILIYGETGTGKEVTARTIHKLSNRCSEPFVVVNCAALPENLLESVLFGHRKGAFTGVVENKEGVFSRTAKGTLLLDEIGDISPTLQVRLLRVLQEHEYKPLGSNKTIHTEARIIAATNRDLKQLIKDGSFREALYYRLNVINFLLPPLRERKDDIPYLTELFIERACIICGGEKIGILCFPEEISVNGKYMFCTQ